MPYSRKASDMLIEATSLTKDFPRGRQGTRLFTAVHPLDIALEAGQLTVITGHSGSGKSTLLSMLAGMRPPTAAPCPWAARTCTRCVTRSARAYATSASA